MHSNGLKLNKKREKEVGTIFVLFSYSINMRG